MNKLTSLVLGMVSAADTEPLIVRDAAGNITSIAGMTPAAALAAGVVIFGGLAYAVSQNEDGTFVVVTTTATATATGTR